MHKLPLSVFLIGMLILSGISMPASSQEIVTIQTGFADKHNQWESDGVVTVQKSIPQLTITLADSPKKINGSGFHSGISNVFLRIEYKEEIPRTIQFSIPKSYFYPMEQQDLEAVNSDQTIDLSAVNGSTETVVTATFESEGSATFAIPLEASKLYGYVNSSRETANKIFGIEVPSVIGGGNAWQYINKGEFSANRTTYRIQKKDKKADYILQYDADRSTANEEWLNVPECSKGDFRLCRFSKSDDPRSIYILSKTNNPPTVRFKKKSGIFGGLGGGFNELGQIPDRFLSDILKPFS